MLISCQDTTSDTFEKVVAEPRMEDFQLDTNRDFLMNLVKEKFDQEGVNSSANFMMTFSELTSIWHELKTPAAGSGVGNSGILCMCNSMPLRPTMLSPPDLCTPC